MSKVVGYPTPGKGKARMLLNAFCGGADGDVVDEIPKKLLPGAAAFYGVTPATAHLWKQAKAEGRDWYYIDNAYFDKVRGNYFRVTRGRLQHCGFGVSSGVRFRALDIEIQPWRTRGEHVLLCPQSDEFMRVCAGYSGSWVEHAKSALALDTRRELRVRPWSPDKTRWYQTLGADLENCWALVTYSSASAITAMLAGVPAIVTAGDCISAGLTSRLFSNIERPLMPQNRERWAAVVADNQWTVEEMRSGLAWAMLHEIATAHA